MARTDLNERSPHFLEQLMRHHTVDSERGESLLGILAALLISAIVLSSGTSFFINSLRHSTDIRSFTQAQITAGSFLDLMSFELRMLGSGMPLTQDDFGYDDPTVGELALPLLRSASPSRITFRMNETGTSAVLTDDFIPSSSGHSLTVDSSIGFNPGDTVYLSSFSTGGTQGLQGVIGSISENTIHLSSFTTTAGARFPASSLIQPVSEVTFNSSLEGVTRTSSRGVSIQSRNTSFELTYLDAAGQPLPLPLTTTAIRESLAGVKIVVREESRSRFGVAATTTEARQTVALRNLILSR
jgi:hypothetical protein